MRARTEGFAGCTAEVNTVLRHPPAGPLRARGVVTALLAPLLLLALGGALVGVADAQTPQVAAGAPSSAGTQRAALLQSAEPGRDLRASVCRRR